MQNTCHSPVIAGEDIEFGYLQGNDDEMKGAIAANLPIILLIGDIPARNFFYKDGKLNNFIIKDYTDQKIQNNHYSTSTVSQKLIVQYCC